MKNVLREKIRKEGKERWRGGGREEERDRKEGLQRQRPDPVGVMTHSSGWAHPETGQGRQEEERNQNKGNGAG